MRRRTRWILTTLTAGLLLIGLVVITLLYTTFGLRSVILPAVERLANMQIETDGLDGSLAGNLRADRVSVTGPGLEIAITDFTLGWEFWDLLGSDVTVHVLTASALSIDVESGEPANDEPFDPPAIDLPVSIHVERARISGIQLNGDALGSVALERSSLADRRLRIEKLVVTDPQQQTAQLQGQIRTVPPYEHELQASASLTEYGNPTLTLGGSTTEGTLALSAPSQGVEFNASYADLLRDPSYSMIANLSEAAPMTGQVRIDSMATTSDALTAFAVEAQLRQDQRQISVTDLQLAVESTESLAIVSGTVSASDPDITVTQLEGTITAQRIDLQLAVSGSLEERRIDGTLAALGRWQEVNITSAGNISDIGDWDLHGTVTPEALRDASLQLDALAGQASVQGSLTWSPSLTYEWSGEFMDMALPQQINGSNITGVSGRFTLSGAGLNIEITIPELAASIDERQLTADGNAALSGSHLKRANLNARSGSAVASAQWHWPLDAALPRVDSSIEISALGDFLPGAGGEIMADISTENGRLTRVDAQLTDLRYGTIALDSATVNGQVELQTPHDFEAAATASGLIVNNEPMGTLHLSAQGRPESFSATMGAETQERRSVDIALDGSWSDESLSGQLTKARLTAEELDIALADSTPFTVTGQSGSIERFCLIESDREARLCLSAAVAPEQRRVTAELISLSSQSLLEFAPLAVRDQLAVQGNISGHAIAVLYPDAPSALSLSLNADALSIGHPSQRQIDGLAHVEIHASLSGDTNSTDLRVSIDSVALTASGEGEVSGWLEPPLKWQAQGAVNAPSLTPFSIWLGGDKATGEVDVRIVASQGPDSDVPQIEGSVRVTRLGLDVPAAETRITDGELTVEFPDTSHFRLRGELPLPGGILKASGGSGFGDNGLIDPDFRIRGEAVTLVDNAQLYLVASPDLRIRQPADQLTIGGRVAFDQVRVLLDSLESSDIVTPSRDVVIRGEEEASNQGVAADVTLDVRQGATVKGRGLDATVSGSLRVQQNPGQPPRATGELMVNGTYKAYGQDLTVTDGRLIYASSPLDNPGISITALRSIDEVEVGVQVSGTAQEPRVELISNSGLNDVATLSYLLFGRPPDRTTVGESDSLSQAALLAALGRTSEQTQNLGQKLGLDQLSFSASSDLGGAAVSLGRYLAPNLYLGYSIGLVSGSELIELRYDLARRWTLRTEVGEESRASVRYRFIQPNTTGADSESDETVQDDNDS